MDCLCEYGNTERRIYGNMERDFLVPRTTRIYAEEDTKSSKNPRFREAPRNQRFKKNPFGNMERDFLEPRTTRIYAEEIQNPKFKESKFQVSVKLREIRG